MLPAHFRQSAKLTAPPSAVSGTDGGKRDGVEGDFGVRVLVVGPCRTTPRVVSDRLLLVGD